MNTVDATNRVRAEYREMPGMQLTLRQAARLFALEIEPCETVLQELVRLEFLAYTNGVFHRR